MNIAVSITEGRTVRDLFYNGLLDYLFEVGFEQVTIFTEAIRVPEFVSTWKQAGVTFRNLYPYRFTSWATRAFWMRRRIVRLKRRKLLELWLSWEQKRFHPPRPEYLELFREDSPALYLATHAHLPRETELISAAHACGIPTLGIVRSWDNVYKGIRSRPKRLAVWNEINRNEVIEFEGYSPEDVLIVGPPQFDPYFASDSLCPREEFAAQFNLDPERPILFFASLGNFFPEFDETAWMDVLLRLMSKNEIVGKPQIICRLHPWSRLTQFEKYASHPDVRLSYVERYWPSLQWYMTRDDVVMMANMLHHSDVVITPGSTVTLEAAIFDRPTIVPVFHPYQPERAKDYFSTWVMGKHFGRIKNNDFVPIIQNQVDFAPAINRALQEPGWYRNQRRQLVNDYVHFTDGRSTKRLAQTAARIARG